MKSIALLAAVLLLTLPGVAKGAFPGENGKIVFEHNSPGFGCDAELFTVNPDGSGTTSISSDPTRGGHLPVWSPDGKRLALAGQSTGCTTRPTWAAASADLRSESRPSKGRVKVSRRATRT